MLITVAKCIQQGLHWESNGSSSRQEIPRIICNLKVHYHVHKSPLLVNVFSHISPRPSAISWRLMLILSSHLRLRVPNGHHPAGFPPKHTLLPPVWVKFNRTSWSRLSNLLRLISECRKIFAFEMCVSYWKSSCIASLQWSGSRGT